MVRNTLGGSNAKRMARKAVSQFNDIDYVPSNPLERVAVVDKLFGNGMCQVITTDTDKLTLLCHIRGKFRGRSKKHNMLTVKSRVVIGLRDWEKPYKNSDLIALLSSYDDNEILDNNNDDLIFTNDTSNELPTNIVTDISYNISTDSPIDIDDI